ncbi:MAG TPA: hypothetical protein VGL00_22085 [Terracidiphilus sp.]
MTLDLKKIYELLPAVYRSRDADLALQAGGMLDAPDNAELQALLSISGSLTAQQERRLEELQDKQQRGPLKALISIIAEQVEVLEESLWQGYDDQFIETCQEWAVPYIADLVAARGLFVFPNANFSLRAEVADTLTNRRRKGTISVLERIARDFTGWDANVVEYFLQLATTQYMNHIRPGNLAFADVRNAEQRLLNTPFDPDAHTADVRNIASGRGKYNLPNIGIFLWGIPSNPMEESPALRLDDLRYFFDAIGRETPLFTFPATEDQPSQRATPLNVAMPISRRMLNANFDDYYGPGKSILLEYTLPGSPLPSPEITACDLSDVKDSGGNVIGWAHQPQDTIGIDPELGRIAFPAKQPAPTAVRVSYYYGFSSNIGGGQYSRVLDSGQDVSLRVPDQFPTIQAALNSAVTQLVDPHVTAVIEIQNSDYYLETPSVTIPSAKSIELRAKDGVRPVLVLSNDFLVLGGDESSLQINGLLIAGGSITLPATDGSGKPNHLNQLTLTHCTLYPGSTPQIGAVAPQPAAPRLLVEAADVTLTIDQCIVGSIRTHDTCQATITNSIVDALAQTEVAFAGLDSIGPAGVLTVKNSTLVGKLHARIIELASNTIFAAQLLLMDLWLGPVLADQLQQGCVRFSYVPPGSLVPRKYRCHPAADDASVVAPAFTSLRCGDPGYCQLAPQSGTEITQGADDQSEMGVFHDLYQPQRESNLRGSLPEYMRFGLEAGIFFAS